MLTDKCPEILETIEFVPIGRQPGLKPFKFFGDERYEIDLTKTDFFTRVIELRTELQLERDKHDKGSAEYARFDAMQKAAKLLANASSYGVLIEVIVDEHRDRVGTAVFHGFETTRKQARARSISEDGRDEISGYKVEKPGKWFAPYGALIPAAGRLLLAIAERLARERGLHHAFCDTDSMFFVRPEDMPRETFLERTQEIAGRTGWFQSLNPYGSDVTLFALEDVNFRLKDDVSGKTLKGVFEPLFCLAVSAKRYALANYGSDGEIIIRKASAHGLGDVIEPPRYNSLASAHTRDEHVAAALSIENKTRAYGDICPGKASRLPPDLWRIAFDQFRRGSPETIDDIVAGLSGMDAPQIGQQALSTRNAWLTYETLPNKRPFMFFNVLPPLRESYFPDPEISAAERRTLASTSLYAAADPNGFRVRTPDEYRALGAGNEGLYSRANHQFPWAIFDRRFSLRFTSIADRLAGYFQHAEQKSRGQNGRLRRKTLVILDHEYIGKETNHLLYANVDEDDEIQIEDAANVLIFQKSVNANMLASLDLDALAQRAGVPKDALRRAIAEERRLAPSAMAKVRAAIHVSNDGELSIAPAPEIVSPYDRRLKTIRNQLIRICDRAVKNDEDAYSLIADEMNRSVPDGEIFVEWTSILGSKFHKVLNCLLEGWPPGCDDRFLDWLEGAINAVFGAGRAKERREKRAARAAAQRVTKTKSMAGLRTRRAEDKRAAWDDGKSTPIDEQDLAEYEIDDRYSVVRTVCVIRTRLPILMVPRVRGVEGAIGRASRCAFARTKDGDKFIEAFPKMLAASIGKIEERREQHRVRMAEKRSAH